MGTWGHARKSAAAAVEGCGSGRGGPVCLALALGWLVAACAASRKAPEPVAPEVSAPVREAVDPLREAQRCERTFREGGPDAPAACVEAVRWLLVADEPARARRLVDEGLEREPDHPELLVLRGNALEREGFRRAAEACYGDALRSDPDHTPARLARGRLRLELGLARAAREDLRRCIADGEDGGPVWLAYGQALAASGAGRRAFDAFERAFQRGVGDAPCLLAAARMLTDGHVRPRRPADEELAAAWLRRAAQVAPTEAEPLLVLARLHEQRGDLDAALGALHSAVSRRPEDLAAWTRLAELSASAGDAQAAASAARRALALERDPRRRERLAELCGASAAVALDGPR